jgi:hypothetical protein
MRCRYVRVRRLWFAIVITAGLTTILLCFSDFAFFNTAGQEESLASERDAVRSMLSNLRKARLANVRIYQ